MKYKCILFDCDGVLVDSESISKQALKEIALRNDIHLNDAFIEEEFVGKALKETFKAIENNYDITLPLDFEKQFRTYSFKLYEENMKPIPGITELIQSLTIPFCVASSGPLNKIELNLKTTGLLPYFKGRIYSAYTIQKWKPDPAIFLHAASDMGFKPEECAVIEDTTSGVQAGINGGFDVYAFSTMDNAEHFTEMGAKSFFKINELPTLLNL